MAINLCRMSSLAITSDVEVTVLLRLILNKTIERLCDTDQTNWNKKVLLNLELLITIGF